VLPALHIRKAAKAKGGYSFLIIEPSSAILKAAKGIGQKDLTNRYRGDKCRYVASLALSLTFRTRIPVPYRTLSTHEA